MTMPKYLLAYHGGGMPESDEEGARVMAAWGAWYQELGQAIVDPGNPVGQAKTMNSDGSVNDGGGPNPVTGYTVISADDLDGAVNMSKGCPILQSGGSVEVCETFDVM
jgi:hypothetical protein